jgi:hypothetical protein
VLRVRFGTFTVHSESQHFKAASSYWHPCKQFALFNYVTHYSHGRKLLITMPMLLSLALALCVRVCHAKQVTSWGGTQRNRPRLKCKLQASEKNVLHLSTKHVLHLHPALRMGHCSATAVC